MDKIEAVIMGLITIFIFSVVFIEPPGLHNETCIIQDKYENEYTQLQPMPAGKGMMLLPITQHDYYFNTTKGVIPVTSTEYNHYNISDTLNISVNSDGRIREVLN